MPETFPAVTWERISLFVAGKQHSASSQDLADHSSPKQSCCLALNGNIGTTGEGSLERSPSRRNSPSLTASPAAGGLREVSAPRAPAGFQQLN